MHYPTMAVIVIDRVMLGTTIVPESDGANAPTEAAGKFRTNLMAEEVVEYRRAFCGSHTVEGYSVGNVDVERPASGFGVNAHNRMDADIFLRSVQTRTIFHAIFTRARRLRFY